MKYTRKYNFTNEAAADAAIAALPHDEEGNPSHGHNIVKLGYITITPAQYDDEGNETTAAVLSDLYAVDVWWSGEPLESWEAFIVWPTPLGIHSFGSSSSRDEYAAKYCELFPDSEYCNPVTSDVE
jgi:hypothetical protein